MSSRGGTSTQPYSNYPMQGFHRAAAPQPTTQGSYYGPEGEQYIR